MESNIGNLAANAQVMLTSSIIGVKPNAVIKSVSGGTDIKNLFLLTLFQRV